MHDIAKSGREDMVVDEKLVKVNRAICERLADELKAKTIPDDKEEIDFKGFSKAELGNLLLFVVAICHQTTVPGRPPLVGVVDGKSLRGWDYLIQRFAQAARADKRLLRPRRWEEMGTNELRLIYRNSDGEDLLTAIDERVLLINDLGNVMKAKEWESAAEIYEQCGGRVRTGSPNLIECLAYFRAYRDPVCKKSFFLLSVMQNTGLWVYKDPALLGPPVDYHEVRGHLRIGTVAVVDSDLRHKLLQQEPVTAQEDIALRAAVFDAIMLISELTGLNNPSKLHYMFWNILRNFCTRENPNCHGDRPMTYLPERYMALVVQDGEREACPFSNVCSSADSQIRFCEHVFETDYF
jgi:hypothetical protein